MPDGLILEFDGVGSTEYFAVNDALGVDVNSPGSASWPDGPLFHAGGARPGGWVVFELWEGRAHQERFMHERLGAALRHGGINAPPARVEWLEIAGHGSVARRSVLSASDGRVARAHENLPRAREKGARSRGPLLVR